MKLEKILMGVAFVVGSIAGHKYYTKTLQYIRNRNAEKYMRRIRENGL